jgi:transcriptional regulator with PAS, ATPase and Fis domain
MRVVETQSALLLGDAQADAVVPPSESAMDLGLRSVLAVPVWFQGEVAGVLYVDSRFLPDAFSQQDAKLLETIADFLRVYLWRAQALRQRADSERRENDLASELEQLRTQLNSLQRLVDASSGNQRQQVHEASQRRFAPILGESPPMLRLYSIMDKIVHTDITALILGESGTGKELVAQALHNYGRRAPHPFVALNCSSIPANLIESELFGHVRGAFTGALREKPGLFEVADKGTLFLDELGDMPLEMQGKLLRALQYGEIQPLGSVVTKKVDVRCVAATHRNLEEMVAQGSFREDLFYRLNTVTLTVPPLRKRQEDIPLLVNHFVEENRRSGISQVKGITPAALMTLMRYPWPGNVRELETTIKSACLFADGTMLDVADFSTLQRSTTIVTTGSGMEIEGRTLAEIEKEVILETLKRNKGNKKKTARDLDIDRRTLYNKLAIYNME